MPVKLVLTGALEGTKYSDLTQAGRREVEKLNKRMGKETNQPQEDARKPDDPKWNTQQTKVPQKKLTIQEYFNQHVCANIDDNFDAWEHLAPNVNRRKTRQMTVQTSNQNLSRLLLARNERSSQYYQETRTRCSDSSVKRQEKTTSESKKNY